MNDLLLTRIANHLMINASFQDDLGIYHGKMSCVLFFAHYSRYLGDLYYAEFASELLDEIYEDLTELVPVNFAYGLCGIAWGVEHLVQSRFTQGDTGEILGDLNAKIMNLDPLRMHDLSFEKGLKGIAYYVYTHVNSPYVKMKTIDDKYLLALNAAVCEKKMFTSQPQDALVFPVELMSNKSICDQENFKLSSYPLGIVDGLAGFGLKLLGL